MYLVNSYKPIKFQGHRLKVKVMQFFGFFKHHVMCLTVIYMMLCINM